MAHQVPWNKIIVETFIEEALLSEEEEMIIRTRVAGWSRTKQSIELGMSVSTVDGDLPIHTETDLYLDSCCCLVNHTFTFVVTSTTAVGTVSSCIGIIKE